jgi:hypothetical protein
MVLVSRSVVFVQPHLMEPLRNSDRLLEWERTMAERFGLRHAQDGGTSTTDTETRPGSINPDCDVKGDTPVSFESF